MIPDEIAKRFQDAYIRDCNAQAFRNEIDAPGLRSQPAAVDYQKSMRAALEAVAADIWEEGENIGYVHGQHDAHRFEPGPDYRETPNPYRASETK